MKKIEVFLLLTILSGCVAIPMPTHPDNISSCYVSPMQYNQYDCQQLQIILVSLDQRECQLIIAQEKKIKTSEIQYFMWGYSTGDGVEAFELAKIRGEKEAVKNAMAGKECGQ